MIRHRSCGDFQNNGPAVPFAHGVCRSDIGAEVNVLARHFPETFSFDGVHEASGGAMIENVRRGLLFQLEVDWNGVTLICPDSLTVVGKAKALFVTFPDDGLQQGEVDLLTVSGHAREEFRHGRPAFGIEGEANRPGIVSEDETQGAAEFVVFFDSRG